MAKQGVKNQKKGKPASADVSSSVKRTEDKSEAKGEVFLVLDLGTSFLKVGLARVNKDKKKVSLLRYDQAPVPIGCFEKKFCFDPQALFAVMASLTRRLEQASGLKPDQCLLAASADYLASQIFSFSFKRPDPKAKINLTEIENTFIKVVRQIKEKIKENVRKTDRKEAPHLIDARLLHLLVDGYAIANPRGLTGQKLEGQIFNIYTLKSCWQKWQEFIRLYQKKELRLLPGCWPLIKALADENCLLIDVGAQQTEVSFKKQGLLRAHLSFAIAGLAFSDALAEALGVGHQEAEEIKLKYAQKELSGQAQARLEKIFEPVLDGWLQAVVVALGDLMPHKLLPEKIFLVGGGSLLPKLKWSLDTTLKNKDLAFLDKEHLLVQRLTTKHLANLKDGTGQMADSQKITIGCLAKALLNIDREKDELQFILEKAVKLAA